MEELQREDKFCAKQIHLLETPVGHVSAKESAEVRRYKIIDGILYRTFFRENTVRNLLCVPKSHRLEVLYSCHDDETAGHLDFEKTWNRIKNRFWWPSILSTVEKYVKTCVSCQTRNVPTLRPAGLLQTFEGVFAPFQRVSIDLTGPVPWSHDRYRCMIVVVDHYS
jgi:Integrase zinc binding domain